MNMGLRSSWYASWCRLLNVVHPLKLSLLSGSNSNINKQYHKDNKNSASWRSGIGMPKKRRGKNRKERKRAARRQFSTRPRVSMAQTTPMAEWRHLVGQLHQRSLSRSNGWSVWLVSRWGGHWVGQAPGHFSPSVASSVKCIVQLIFKRYPGQNWRYKSIRNSKTILRWFEWIHLTP